MTPLQLTITEGFRKRRTYPRALWFSHLRELIACERIARAWRRAGASRDRTGTPNVGRRKGDRS